MFSFFQFLKQYPSRLKRMNYLLFFCVVIEATIGVFFIYGSGQLTGGSFSVFWKKQLIWIGLGSLIMIMIAGIDYQALGRYSWLIYFGFCRFIVNGTHFWQANKRFEKLARFITGNFNPALRICKIGTFNDYCLASLPTINPIKTLNRPPSFCDINANSPFFNRASTRFGKCKCSCTYHLGNIIR